MRTQANRGMALRLDLVEDRLAMSHNAPKAVGSPNPLVSLSEYLRQTHQDGDRQMTPKQQKTLALSIASSILQLYETVWCSPSWDSLTIRLHPRALRGADHGGREECTAVGHPGPEDESLDPGVGYPPLGDL